MKRNPRKQRWTKAFRKAAGKELVLDKTCDFEKRRNIPVRYDRDLMANPIKAMKRVQELRNKRERKFYKDRVQSVAKVVEKEQMIREVQRDLVLVKAPESLIQSLCIFEDSRYSERDLDI